MEDATKEKRTLGKRKHLEETESKDESDAISSGSESEDESEYVSSDSESEPDSERTISQDDNIGRKQRRTRITVQPPQNEEPPRNAELNAAAMQPPPNTEVNPTGAETIADAAAAPLHPLPENPAAAAPIETLPPNAAPAVALINQLAKNVVAAVDPPSQGVAAIDDVLVTPPDCGIEVVEATSAEQELIKRELSESITNLLVQINVENGDIAEKESVIEELTHKYWESNRDPKENVETDKEVHEEINRNIMMIAKMAVAHSEMGPLPLFDLGIDFGSQTHSQSQPEKEKEHEQETEKLDQDVQKQKSKEIQQHQGPAIKTPRKQPKNEKISENCATNGQQTLKETMSINIFSGLKLEKFMKQ
ncbi:hypothetical protein PIB30_042511 [Stylosanthes scabra]|uniref:Uncharacterized protein n=1 Tax=Stylosanthes scabra TaxID=79078 RepID=A0ABU6SFD2_9FABA|nr:hypothetical protein [Stylosanthes scabra]